MQKLFVALGIPEETAERLAAIQPQPRAGIRLVEPRQMHLTLHYIGEVDAAKAARMGDSLAAVDVPAFSLTLAAIGCFPPSKGAVTLWSGVQGSAELQSLHTAIAKALAAEGFQPEARPYTPHVTLARCEEAVSTPVVSEFLTGPGTLLHATMPVNAFGLYSTAWVGEAPYYQLEREFALRL